MKGKYIFKGIYQELCKGWAHKLYSLKSTYLSVAYSLDK